MIKVVITALPLALAVGAACGRLGDVITSFRAPANYPIALAVEGTVSPYYLYVYCNTSPYRIYKTNAVSGSIFSSFVSPQGIYTRGLTYSFGGGGGLPTGSYLWMGNYSTDRIYRCNPDNGTVYASFPANHDMSAGLAAMAIGNGGRSPTYMLSGDDSPRCVYRQSLTNGSIYSSFGTSLPIYDLAWDWLSRVIWTGNTGNGVYAFTTGGLLAASFPMPVNNPLAFAYNRQYLWVGTTAGSHRIWMIHCPDLWPAVGPVSIGRVKALFR
jgi:hypothetical protein